MESRLSPTINRHFGLVVAADQTREATERANHRCRFALRWGRKRVCRSAFKRSGDYRLQRCARRLETALGRRKEKLNAKSQNQ